VAETANSIHAKLRIPLTALVILHIGAALNHAPIKWDGMLQRIGFTR